ncbi:MAG: dephospho-CoA kinase [Clostridia bacterium]|nr:dephospho-CoA kinase [Clostridia bacterium]
MSKIIGLTGPTGAGKSYACLMAGNIKNLKIIDCDKLARKAVKKDSKGLCALVNVFSAGILKKDGTLNRRELARRAFSSPENTKLLNDTLFPYICDLVFAELTDKKSVLLDAPTLFESGLDKICDTTIAVLASNDIRLLRIKARDNISQEDALLRMSAGKDDEFYKTRAEHIVQNNGNISEYTAEFLSILKHYTEE